jgi:2-oxoisovalerate dehydrogenase E2 component (dihydrolipoyl transacylase)
MGAVFVRESSVGLGLLVPVVLDDDAIAVRSIVNPCLSFDHRILGGAQAGDSLRSVERLEAYGPDTPLA